VYGFFGFSPWEIKQQLGHANLATTAIYLDHLAPSAHIAKVHARRTVI
jgi:site-specific recombinase XerD